ncbi:serine/threonine-protein kinase [Krasilnikovia sp. MM14-A1259]|uniref:serine/threonine-protein kinase n=1 Tax=Krasilnikovia sp. MM14-A1259 TaxID=3373539 RepID=UPI003801DF44
MVGEQQVLGGRYTLLDELGRGGTAVVWRARDEVLGRPVAVKVLAGGHAADPHSRARIRTEARAAAALSHPNIAQIHDYGESTRDGQCVPYVVMELVEGETLQQRVSVRMLAPREVFRVCGQVAAALAAAHAEGLVHRDIKPANVMVAGGSAKVVDFGIAATAGPEEPESELLGTPAYLAPERLTGDTVEPASDVYALGVLLYRLLAGDSPWAVESTTQLLTAHVHVAPSPLPDIPGVPAAVSALVDRCLRKDPSERPTAAEAAAVLVRAEIPVLRAAVQAAPTGRAAVAAPQPPAPPVPSHAAVSQVTPAPAAAASAPRPKSAGPDRSSRVRRRRLRHVLGGVLAGAALMGLLSVWQTSQASTGDAGNRAAAPPVMPGASGSHRPSSVTTRENPHKTDPAPGRGGAQQVTAVAGVPVGEVGDRGNGDAGVVRDAGPPPVPSSPPAPRHTTSTSWQPTTPDHPPTTTPVTDPTTEPTTEPTTQPPQPPRTFESEGGTVEVLCTAPRKARLLSWNAVAPYRVLKVEPGPAGIARVVFRNGPRRIRMTATCTAGSPAVDVTVLTAPVAPATSPVLARDPRPQTRPLTSVVPDGPTTRG